MNEMQLTTPRTVLSAAALVFLFGGLGPAFALRASARQAPDEPLRASAPQAMDDPASAARVKRGGYLVGAMGCNDCHTPWKLGPKGPEPDMTRALSGHPADFTVTAPPKLEGAWAWSGAATNTAFAGPWGVSFTANLTPDMETGLGKWSAETFIAALRTGRHEGKG